ncbi:hypothetical protein DYB32_003154 [Aphanomyces invadans]|uniref:Uncharacterized protein n=1 Tax=Aphanomyces invadans TaxID=157072 RepID=A0A3R6VDM7_9STRA|nr:hypothetical protein DYB32_003154 [Aphanomyces invadans]
MGCRYSVVKKPPRFGFVCWWRRAPHATLFVDLDAGTMCVSADSTGESDTMDVMDVHVEPKGVRQIVLFHHAVFPNTTVTTFDMETPAYAIEFIAMVNLIHHMKHIQAQKPKLLEAHHDSVLMAQMQNTIEYATAMWTMALWKDLFPYSRLKENLVDALASLRTDIQQALHLLDATYHQFYAYASVTEVEGDASSQRHFRASYVGLLVAKVRALYAHLAQYCAPPVSSKSQSAP